VKGSVFKRLLPSGKVTWCLQVEVGRSVEGKRVRLFRSGFPRKADAERELRRLLVERDAGTLVKPDPHTFGAFLNDWFENHASRHCAPKTIERYRQLATYLLPHIGHLPLAEITPLQIERLLNHLKDAGGRDRKTGKARPLSAKTVRHIAGLLSVALGTAVRWKLIRTSPMAGVQIPRPEHHEKGALDADQLYCFLETAKARAKWLYPILVFAASTGARRGEMLALRWSDIDMRRGLVRITKSLEQTRKGLRLKPTKTGLSRIVPVPKSVVSMLEQLQVEQEENRQFFGTEYRSDLDLVFCAPNGDYLKPDSVTAKACLIAREAGLKGVGLHTLRHTHGSQLLSAGVPLPTVSKRLGHSSTWVTANIYSHAMLSDELAAAQKWDAVFGARIAGVQPEETR
jgi:integrase